ncbi:HlyD family efflux transporter periplasmic adaptor subunit [Candidatus Parcubacteria bacterium]|jgi:multidrug efflux pump subunit AcrA (membrane-fusion protein)|nr:HlyD family efflux transporter periplasmic adaptor subunit [Candidatus Parcubacteria bacterium]MBT3948899.1 HlyD family efflux transporter periplasmic adaptor subunit [Candidatus Parcubacteria bacterium]
MKEQKESIGSILEQSKKSRGIYKYISLFKNKKFIIIFSIFVASLGSFYVYGKMNNDSTNIVREKVTASVKKGDIRLTIQSDGNIVAKDGVDLSFSETGVRIEEVYVSEGDMVKKGDKIARIETNELYIDLQSSRASLTYASSRLKELEAGATDSDLASYINAVESSKVALDKIIYQNEFSIKEAERAVETAKNNLKLAEGGQDSAIVKNAYEDLLGKSLSSLNTLASALTDSDNILGIDNTFANDEFESVLSTLNPSNLSNAKTSYLSSKSVLQKAENSVVPLVSISSYTAIISGAELVKEALVKMQQHLYDVQETLDTTIPIGDLSQSELDALRTGINTAKSAVIASLSSLNTSMEAIETAENSYETYLNAYDESIDDLEETKKDVEATELSARLSLENLENSLNKQIEPASETDIASARSSVASAQSSVNKILYQIQEATITSPIDGELVLLNGKTGDIVVEEKNEPFCIILNKDVFYVETQIEEMDISKIKQGQKAYVTIDALDSAQAEGEVSFVSLVSAENNGIVTYKVRVLLENTEVLDIREGMSVYVDFIITEANSVLMTPVQAVKNVDGKPSVTMEDGSIRNVVTGFTDGKTVEIISGLEMQEKVVY